MIGADHIPALGAELDILFNIIAWALSASVLFWILYIALEPYVRRLWPRLIISWSRLLAGGFRDPMVGRDILIGSLLGFGHTLSICLMPVTSKWAGKPSGLINSIDPRTLQGGRSVITSLLTTSLVQWFTLGVGLLFILLLFYILLRRQWLAALAMWLLFATVEVLAFAIPGPFTFWIGPLLNASLGVVAAARFGLLTTISKQFFFDLSFHYAITPNLSSWHAQTTFIILPILITVALYSFYTSLAGQPLFRGGVLRD